MKSSLPSQPPPDLPAPPAGAQAIRSRKKMGAILWLGALSILFVCAPPLYLVFLNQDKGAIRTKALSNLRQLGIELHEFHATYGRYPDASTAAKVKADTGTPLTLGSSSSNQLFRQLLVTGPTMERYRHARIAGSKKPDELFHDDTHALAPGECGYAYVTGLDASADPGAILAASPMIPGTTLFDPEPFGGYAVILRADNSVTSIKLSPSGHATSGGRDIFDPSQGYWNGKAPDIKWQE